MVHTSILFREENDWQYTLFNLHLECGWIVTFSRKICTEKWSMIRRLEWHTVTSFTCKIVVKNTSHYIDTVLYIVCYLKILYIFCSLGQHFEWWATMPKSRRKW